MFRPCRDRSVAGMPSDLRPGPDSPPTDELASAEASLTVLQHVLHSIAADDKTKQTPCADYTVKELTEHLLNSIIALGGAVDADLAVAEDTDSIERLVIGVARPALDAWHRSEERRVGKECRSRWSP